MPFFFFPVFVNSNRLVSQHRPGFHQRYLQFFAELSIAHLHHWKTTVSVIYWHRSARWSLEYSRVKPGVCERVYKQHMYNCWPIYRPATGHSSGQLRALPGSRPVNSRPAKRPGCVNTPMLSCVPLLCPAISGTCRPGENRNMWTRPKRTAVSCSHFLNVNNSRTFWCPPSGQ